MAFRQGNGFVQDQIDRNSAATRLRQYVAMAANICGSADMPSSWLENFELGQISLKQPMAEILINSSIFLSLREEMAMVIGSVCAAYRWASQSEIPWPAR